MDIHEWLEAYFDHSIVEVQRKELEAKAKEDPALARMLRTQRNSLMAMEALGEEKLRLELNRMLEDWQELKAKRRARNLKVTMAVGLFVILIGLGGWLGYKWMQVPHTPKTRTIIHNPSEKRLPEPTPVITPKPQTLALRYFEPLDLELEGISSRHRAVARQASEAYRNANFAVALPLLESIIQDYRKPPESLRMMLGVTYLADDQPGDAIRTLLPLMYGTSAYDDKARWYLALAYFRQGNFIEGMGMMEEARRFEGHFKQEEAQRFLGQLKGETGI